MIYNVVDENDQDSSFLTYELTETVKTHIKLRGKFNSSLIYKQLAVR